MTKKIFKLLVLTMVLMLALTGCKLVAVDKANDDNVVVAEYKGGTILKGDAAKNYNDVVAMYEASGYGDALKDAELVKNIKTEVLDYMVKDEIYAAKAKEFGVDTIPEEKRVELVKNASNEFNQLLDMYTPSFKQEGQTDEEARETTKAYLEQNGYSEKVMQTYALSDYKEDMLIDYVTKDVTISDEDLKKAYDERVASDKETYEAKPESYGSDITYGESPMWAPEGYRTVKHILLANDATMKTEMYDLEDQLAAVQAEIDARANPDAAEEETAAIDAVEGDAPDEAVPDAPQVQGATLDNTGDEPVVTTPETVEANAEAAVEAATDAVADTALNAEEAATDAVETAAEAATDAVADVETDATDAIDELAVDTSELGEDTEVTVEPVTAEDEFIDAAPEEPEVDYTALTDEELTAKKAEIEQKIADLTVKMEEALQPKVAEVQAKIDAGEDFNALIEQYGEDPGMKSEPTKTTGYYVAAVSTMWDPAFTEGAMALEKIGDVSGPISGQSGIHFIRYESDVTPGAVDFETVKESLSEAALENRKTEVYDTTTQSWIDEAAVKLYPEKL